jgi:hypothetical protein
MPREAVANFVETALLPPVATDAWREFLGKNPDSTLTWSREEYADGYRVDILLQENGSNLLVIENKIASPLRRHQHADDDVVRSRLPTVYLWRSFAEVGGLMSYGLNLTDNFRRAATYRSHPQGRKTG